MAGGNHFRGVQICRDMHMQPLWIISRDESIMLFLPPIMLLSNSQNCTDYAQESAHYASNKIALSHKLRTMRMHITSVKYPKNMITAQVQQYVWFMAL